jgi:fascin 1/2
MALPVKPGDRLPWSLGLRDATGKYLTVETFGNAMNINGVSLKKKQIFTLEQDEGAGARVYIRTPKNRYLSATPNGIWSADGESKGPNELFEIEVQQDGRWALKSAHGYYCGGVGEKIDAFSKTIAVDRLFTVHLAMHPQVSMWNVNRKTFCHLSDNSIDTDEPIPWGADATLTLQFISSSGKYAIQTCDFRYLNQDGSLIESPESSAQYTLQFMGGQLAFIAQNGNYLTSVGGPGTMRATKPGPPGRDELYVLEDSHPQIKLTAWQGKKVSVRSSVEATANQKETTDAETFQLEINDDGSWCLRCHKNTFWYATGDGVIKTDGASKSTADTHFQIEWHGPKIAIKASNGNYITVKKSGVLIATAASIDE